MGNTQKRAFVLMPFKEPFDSYYPAIFKPALEAAEYEVTRASDLFTPSPIIIGIQNSIVNADLVLCEMTGVNPNVFYELGLAHAIGKPAILLSQNVNDIPFDLRFIRTILYNFSQVGWEEKLRREITSFALAIAATPLNKVWPPPLKSQNSVVMALQGLGSEIADNLYAIDVFTSKDISYYDEIVTVSGQVGARLPYVVCTFSIFQSLEAKNAINTLDPDIKRRIDAVYLNFRDINSQADSLHRTFRPQKVTNYLDTISKFNTEMYSDAKELSELLKNGNAGQSGQQ